MKFLLDQNVSPALVDLLSEADHDAEHVGDLGMSEAPDDEVLVAANNAGAVMISSDTDFGEILANLDAVADDLSAGAFVVLADDRVRVRSLPFRPED